MSSLTLEMREASKVHSTDELAKIIEEELKAILDTEKDKISSSYYGYTPCEAASDIAKDIARRIIWPYIITHRLTPNSHYGNFMKKLGQLDLIGNRGAREFGNFETAIEIIIDRIPPELREVYQRLYSWCCNTHFQRICGVELGRKDTHLDYPTMSRKIRPGRDHKKPHWSDYHPLNDEDEVYD